MKQVHISFVMEDGTHYLSIVCDNFLPFEEGKTVYSFEEGNFIGVKNTVFIDTRGEASQQITLAEDSEFWR